MQNPTIIKLNARSVLMQGAEKARYLGLQLTVFHSYHLALCVAHVKNWNRCVMLKFVYSVCFGIPDKKVFCCSSKAIFLKILKPYNK